MLLLPLWTFDLSLNRLPEILVIFSLSEADLPDLYLVQRSVQRSCSQHDGSLQMIGLHPLHLQKLR